MLGRFNNLGKEQPDWRGLHSTRNALHSFITLSRNLWDKLIGTRKKLVRGIERGRIFVGCQRRVVLLQLVAVVVVPCRG
jgi:hypothetical protein